MSNAIIQQGKFTSDGTDAMLELRADVDWLRVYNYTQMAATNNGYGYEYLWQRGMTAGDGIVYYHPAADHTSAVDTCSNASVTGFTLIDTSSDAAGTLNATITAVSNAAIPIVSATSTAGIANNDVVRFINVTNAQQLGGFDFTVDTVVANTSFRLPYMSQLAVAGTTGSFRKVNYDPIFEPPYRYIASISKAASAVVELTVTHSYEVGQAVRFVVPAAYGMVQMNGLSGNITAVNTTTNTITVDIDSTSFTTFAFPATAAVPFSPAMVVPYGEAVTSTATGGRVFNEGYIGIELAAGTKSPGGNNSDVIYWVAGKSFSDEQE